MSWSYLLDDATNVRGVGVKISLNFYPWTLECVNIHYCSSFACSWYKFNFFTYNFYLFFSYTTLNEVKLKLVAKNIIT